MEGSRLADGALSLITAISAVQLVVAPLFGGVADRPAHKVSGRPLRCSPATHKEARRAAPAAVLIGAGLGAVPVPVAMLLRCVAAARRPAAHALPGKAVSHNAVGGIEATPL